METSQGVVKSFVGYCDLVYKLGETCCYDTISLTNLFLYSAFAFFPAVLLSALSLLATADDIKTRKGKILIVTVVPVQLVRWMFQSTQTRLVECSVHVTGY